MTIIERKYALTKIGKGDYLLPDNDGRTLWRLHQYDDVVASASDSTAYRNVRLWAVSKWGGLRPGDEMIDSIVDEDWGLWEWHAGGLRTRNEAIQEALKLSWVHDG